jgi:ABC-2 type transport system permease protein
MWFKNVYLKTLRETRIAILGWGIGMGLLMYAVLAAVNSLIATPAARASLVSLADSFAWLAEPVHIDTPGGYLTWKYGFTVLVICIWPLLVCSRILRGEEERGSLDVVLATPQSRVSVALQKLAAVLTALLGMGLLIGLLTALAGSRINANFNTGDAILFGLNIALISAVFGSIALFLSQFTENRRVASGITGGLLVLAIAVDMVHRVIPNTDWFSRLSPVYYYNLSKPLIPSYGTNVGALLVMVVLCVILDGAAIWLFARRDIGRTVAGFSWLQRPERAIQPAQALPANAWSLRSLYTRSLARIVVPTLWWTLAIAGFAAWMVAIVKQTEGKLASLENSSYLGTLLSKVGGGSATANDTLLSFIFAFLPLLLMAFAVTQASSWAADEEEGRLELILATPQSRLRVLLGRFAALTTATIFIGVLTLAATAIAAAASGLTLDGGNLVAATLGMIPLGLLVAAIGYLLSGWLRTVVDTGILSFLLVIWFFITFVGPELSWPDSTLRFSPFYYYGTPLLHGLLVGDTIFILALGAVALAVATWRFMRKDIAR